MNLQTRVTKANETLQQLCSDSCFQINALGGVRLWLGVNSHPSAPPLTIECGHLENSTPIELVTYALTLE